MNAAMHVGHLTTTDYPQFAQLSVLDSKGSLVATIYGHNRHAIAQRLILAPVLLDALKQCTGVFHLCERRGQSFPVTEGRVMAAIEAADGQPEIKPEPAAQTVESWAAENACGAHRAPLSDWAPDLLAAAKNVLQGFQGPYVSRSDVDALSAAVRKAEPKPKPKPLVDRLARALGDVRDSLWNQLACRFGNEFATGDERVQEAGRLLEEFNAKVRDDMAATAKAP
jgi:hypothetical protein